jgi:hypothetical protein
MIDAVSAFFFVRFVFSIFTFLLLETDHQIELL